MDNRDFKTLQNYFSFLPNDPLLGNLLLVAQDGILTVTGTDNYTSLQLEFPINQDLKPVVIPFETIRRLKPTKEITFELSDHLLLKSGNLTSKIKTLVDFLRIDFDQFITYSIETNKLLEVIGHLSKATNPKLNQNGEKGTKVFFEKGYAIASNKTLLARIEQDLYENVVLDIAQLNTLAKFVKGQDVLTTGNNESELYVEFEGVKIKNRLYRMEFGFVPKFEGKRIKIQTDWSELKNAFDQMFTETALILDGNKLTILSDSTQVLLENRVEGHGFIKIASETLKSLLDLKSDGEFIADIIQVNSFQILAIELPDRQLYIAGINR